MPKQDGSREKYAREMVLDRLSTAADGNSDVYLKAVDYEKLYHNYIDETENPYLSNISLPWPYIICESYLGKCIQVLAAMMPYVHVVEEDSMDRDKARRVEKDANTVLYKHKWPVLSYQTYKQMFKYGTAFMMEKPWGKLNGEEMPLLSLMNFFHVYVNPTVLTLDDEDAYVIYEVYIPKERLQGFKGNVYYKNLDKIEIYDGDIYTEEERTIQAFKERPSFENDKYSELVQCYYYWSHKDFIILTGDNNVIRDDFDSSKKGLLNLVAETGKIPIKAISAIPLDNEFYGLSLLEQGRGLFAEANENRNQMNDAANIMLNPQWIVDRDRAQLKTRTITARAGNIIWTDDVNAIVPQPQDWNLLAMGLKRQEQIYFDIMNYSNAFPQMRGQSQKGTDTATEYVGMMQAGELRSDTYNLLLSMMGVESLVEDVVTFKRLFMTEPSSFYYWPDYGTSKVTPEDYEARFSYKAFAGFKRTQDIERKQLIEAMTLVFGGANGAFLPYVMPKAEEWLDRLLDSFPDIRSPEQLRLSEQERAMAQVMGVMQQMMPMIGMGGRPGEQPAMGEKAMRMPENEPNSPMGAMLRNISPGQPQI